MTARFIRVRLGQFAARTNSYLGAVSPWACVLMLAACGGDDPVSVTEDAFSVSLTLTSVTLLPGETAIVDARAIDSQGSTVFGKAFLLPWVRGRPRLKRQLRARARWLP